MRALTWRGREDIRCERVPDPIIEDGRDAIIRVTAFANYAFEHHEIAAYKSLIMLAEANGHASGLAALLANLDEEKAMAAAIEAGLRPLTLQFARRSEAGVTAKV